MVLVARIGKCLRHWPRFYIAVRRTGTCPFARWEHAGRGQIRRHLGWLKKWTNEQDALARWTHWLGLPAYGPFSIQILMQADQDEPFASP
jgi:hypothetical protein